MATVLSESRSVNETQHSPKSKGTSRAKVPVNSRLKQGISIAKKLREQRKDRAMQRRPWDKRRRLVSDEGKSPK